ncbi:hypothetical protein [cf. Phormidesmis sp. LEGE 11477]|uniref:hypothetical protein n=1 Tax=cf. Phormidesmis sp. LEGE 11477 TaxID=1828680 RepID=UPI00188140D2|nr:hypothetical protein [cf. Phormidesmis sp. LEGE 11477]MBE9064937.1 hypothetical protein [cf. Phormidesmis sp. LEGE 11477]
MFISSAQGATASTDSVETSVASSASVPPNTPNNNTSQDSGGYEVVRHLLFGPLPVIQSTIHLLHQIQYAEPNDWSQPISTGKPNEMMAILTKRVRIV